MAKRLVYYCGIPIEYTLTRKAVKNLNIRINQDGEIFVSANKSIPIGRINQFVESRAEWVIRNLADVERYNQQKPDGDMYQGKNVFFLGEKYVVEVVESETEQVLMENGIISIYTKDSEDSDYMKAQYLKWLKGQSKVVFKTLLDKSLNLVQEENIPTPQFSIRNMRSRWGSCSPHNKSISLNLQLIKSDKECIEKVIIHELMHFKQPGHGVEFYALLEKYMPNWKEVKQRLEECYKDGI